MPEGLGTGLHPGNAGLLFLAGGEAAVASGGRREALLIAEAAARDALSGAIWNALAQGQILAVFPPPWPDRPLTRALREAARIALLRGPALEREVQRADAEFRMPRLTEAQAAALAQGAAASRLRRLAEAAPLLALAALPAALCETAGRITLVLAWSAWLDANIAMPARPPRQPLAEQWRSLLAPPPMLSVWVDERGQRVVAGFGHDNGEARFWLRRRLALGVELRRAEALMFVGDGMAVPTAAELQNRAGLSVLSGPQLVWLPLRNGIGGFVIQPTLRNRQDY